MTTRLTNVDLRQRKGQASLVSVTAYDFWGARMAQEAGVDFILVGDSLGNVIQGHDTTLPVTLEDILYHTRHVIRGAPETFVVADMPYLSFHITPAETVANAGRLIKEGGAQAVKIEGGLKRREMIRACVDAEIPVMGHVGLTPQSVVKMGGYTVQSDLDQVLSEARAVEESGAFAIVLECVEARVARAVTEALSIPTIGIGAGSTTDGQILVWHDLLGLHDATAPKFVKAYASFYQEGITAMTRYASEVRNRSFPGPEHTYGHRKMKAES